MHAWMYVRIPFFRPRMRPGPPWTPLDTPGPLDPPVPPLKA